jgi:predicted TIM-barrel fold metal-dependent hydrolase
VVIEHAMGLRAGGHDTLRVVCDMARFPNAYAKLTFVVGGSEEPYPYRDMHDFVHRIIEAYGPDRCMWGSAFPCELWCPKVTFGEHLRLFTEEIPLEASVRRAILGDTPMRLWFS